MPRELGGILQEYFFPPQSLRSRFQLASSHLKPVFDGLSCRFSGIVVEGVCSRRCWAVLAGLQQKGESAADNSGQHPRRI